MGVQPADIISLINGESTQPITAQDAVNKLRGPKGTKVTVTFTREGLAKPFELTITREEIPLYSVPYAFLLPDGTGYILIRNFAENTTDELEEKLAALSKQGMKSLILDLRGNAGGALIPAIEISDACSSPRATWSSRSRAATGSSTGNSRPRPPTPTRRCPWSSSSTRAAPAPPRSWPGRSWTTTAAWSSARIPGARGSSSRCSRCRPDMAVAITIAQYYTPSGRSIQRDYTHLDDYLLDKVAADKPREVSYTSKGRKVLGQGGITPDYDVKFTLQIYTFELRSQGAFFTYARKFLAHQTALSADVHLAPASRRPTAKGKIQIAKPFLADKAVLEDFRDYLTANKIDADAKKFKAAEAEIAARDRARSRRPCCGARRKAGGPSNGRTRRS